MCGEISTGDEDFKAVTAQIDETQPPIRWGVGIILAILAGVHRVSLRGFAASTQRNLRYLRQSGLFQRF